MLESHERVLIGDAFFDRQTGELKNRDGVAVLLRHKSAEVLKMLAASRGAVVSKSDLLDTVWDDVVVTEDSLVQCIADIRRALGDTDHKLVTTIPKRGYRLARATAVADDGNGVAQWRPSRMWTIAAAVVATVAAAVAMIAFYSATDTPHANAKPSIAVLPFADLSGEDRWSRLALGISNDIANDLGRHKWLVVTPPDVSLAQRESGSGGFEGGAGAFVLDGTIQAEGTQLRVSARLTDSASGEIVWSERWSRPAEGIFSIQDEILEKIDAALASTWSGVVDDSKLAAAKAKAPARLDAYELFLLGNEHVFRFTWEDFEAAEDYYSRSLALDPDFSQALIGLGLLRHYQALFGPDRQTRLAYAGKRDALAPALLNIAGDQPHALLKVGFANARLGRIDDAAAGIRRAVQAAPNNPDLLAEAAILLMLWTRSGDEAAGWIDRAYELNPEPGPTRPFYRHAQGFTAFINGDFKNTYEIFKDDPVPAPNLIMAGAAAMKLGLQAEARDLAARFRDVAPPGMTVREFLDVHGVPDRHYGADFLSNLAEAGFPV